MGGIGRLRGLAAIGVVCVCALLASAGGAVGRPAQRLRTVRFHGLSVQVPRSWPVYNLARHPQFCVRFDRHAVYLGTPGTAERCPAHAVGRTEAILLSPLTGSHGAPAASGGALGVQGNATSFSVPSARVEVIATWNGARGLITRALGRRSLPGPSQGTPSASGAALGLSNPNQQSASSSKSASVFTGLGFDACSAPSTSQMSAWSSSPYRAVGVYIGGSNEACAQPNLTQKWISHAIASGWHPFPIYVSRQAPFNACGCAPISTSTSRAAAQGRVAAASAVFDAKRLGIAAGNPIYDDMEGYSTGPSNTKAVLAFLSGWTKRLHAAGYISGVYSSASSGVRDLVSRYHKRYPEPDDIWIADWNGRKSASDPYVPAGDWPHHQRLHQYAGNRNERYGGVTLSIDADYVNGATVRQTASR